MLFYHLVSAPYVERNRHAYVRPSIRYFSACPSLSCERIALHLSLPSWMCVRLWKPCVKASKWLSSPRVISISAHFSGVMFYIPDSLSRPISCIENNTSPKTLRLVLSGSSFRNHHCWVSSCRILPFWPVFVSVTETNDELVLLALVHTK